ncbi:MAG: 3-dehydroquinate synthase [Gemmatimonadaceae bacterium]
MNDATGGPRARAGGTASAVAARISLPTYDVTVAPGSLDSVGDVARRVAPAHRYAVVTDGNVGPLYARRVVESFAGEPLHVVDIPAGEAQKTRANWGQVTDALLDAGCGRDTTIVALGGGVVGDLAGFVAATFMRGVPYVQVPTTLLAMVDASVGGKTGVDTPAGKNLVGAFHQPVAVIVDPAVLATLPLAHRRAGLAEALKHGIIADAGYFDRTAHDPDSLWIGAESDRVTALIARSIEIKADVVRRDEREGGLRKVLNFGHTLGHAIEAASGYALLHGEAVAIGMVLESELAERAGVADAGTAMRIREAVQRVGLPIDRPRAVEASSLLAATRGDKKARAGSAEYALPRRIGAMAGEERGWGIPVDERLVLEVLA